MDKENMTTKIKALKEADKEYNILAFIAFGSIAAVLAADMIEISTATNWDRAIFISLLFMGSMIPARLTLGDYLILKLLIIGSSLITLGLLIAKSGGLI